MRTEPTATPKERAWLSRLQRLIDSQPPGTWVYLNGEGGASLNLMRLAADGKRVMARNDYDGYSQEYVIDTVDAPHWDGGGW